MTDRVRPGRPRKLRIDDVEHHPWVSDTEAATARIAALVRSMQEGLTGRQERTPVPKGPHVYFVQQGDDGPVKVGFSATVRQRLDALQSGNPNALHLRHAIPGSVADEQAAHRALAPFLVRGEWYEGWAALSFAEDILNGKGRQVPSASGSTGPRGG